MLKVVADENSDGTILRGVRRRLPTIDMVRIQDVGLSGADDQTVPEWAATEQRLLLTHDAETITKYAYERVRLGAVMAGVIEVRQEVTIQQAIEDILLVVICSSDQEWEGLILYLPL
jgi:predicted nuclease of predicted toxin-antitoxin system